METRYGWGFEPRAADGNCNCLEEWMEHVVWTNEGHPDHEFCSLEDTELPVLMEVQGRIHSFTAWVAQEGRWVGKNLEFLGLIIWSLELCSLLSHHLSRVKRGKNKQHSLPPTLAEGFSSLEPDPMICDALFKQLTPNGPDPSSQRPVSGHCKIYLFNIGNCPLDLCSDRTLITSPGGKTR